MSLQAPSLSVIGGGGYEIRIAPGSLATAGDVIGSLVPSHRFAVISDSNVAALHAGYLVAQLERQGASALLCTIPAGERFKTRETWAAVTDELLAAGLGRDSTIVALGGGVVCDLAGFVAATFMRGVPVVHIPTTLLAMIDASIGGKTGVDTLTGKNLVGAFHQPAAVLIDPEILATLPLEELRSGMAEAIKHGAIADAGYFEYMVREMPRMLAGEPSRRDVPALGYVIEKSVRLKAGFVAADEKERGARKSLNFGHTIGHAIETLSGYTMRHGEAVGVGMLLETTAAERAGITQAGTSAEILASLRSAGLPVTRPTGPTATAILDAMSGDKKRRAGSIEYAVPRRIGTMAAAELGYTVLLPDAIVRGILEEVTA